MTNDDTVCAVDALTEAAFTEKHGADTGRHIQSICEAMDENGRVPRSVAEGVMICELKQPEDRAHV